MSGLEGRTRADHRHAAATARQLPGTWVLAATYGSSQSATSAAWHVRTGNARMPAYQPAGAFESRTELTQDGADLYVRYVAPQPAQGAAR
jgi:hypothetical protein